MIQGTNVGSASVAACGPPGQRGRKVIGIGLPKTGTTTLGACLTQLGYRVCGFDPVSLEAVASGNIEGALERSSAFDAFQDGPWFMIYRELDERYPDSLFILTERRDAGTWYRSGLGHASRMTDPVSRWASGTFVDYFARQGIGSDQPLKMYEHHSRAVREYFGGRPSCFKVLNWEAGDAWPQLCEFLGLPAPEIDFPHLNAAPH